MQFRERYDILRLIGRGTTASVFLVRDKHLDKKWAAKIYDSGLLQTKAAWWMIQNEVNVLKMLNSSQMPRIVDLCRESGMVCLVMDYMEGITLKAYIEQYGPVSEETALAWLEELCKLLILLHQSSPMIIYIDLKPENIVIDENGALSLIDFGSARLKSNQGQIDFSMTGTAGYTAPELFSYGDDCRELLAETADVYSVGAVGFYMITGLHPSKKSEIFGGKCREETIVSRPFRKLIDACMEEKKQRIPTILQVVEKIHKFFA